MTQPYPEDLTGTQQRFSQRYQENSTPWDTNISPPELVAALADSNNYPAGRALDIGCGTGTNSITMALHGWHVIGIDFTEEAVTRATQKAQDQQEAIKQAGGSVSFLQADVTRLEPPKAEERAQLLLDIGCMHSIPHAYRRDYARVVAEQAAPGALFLLYILHPRPDGSGPPGSTAEEVDALLRTTFLLEQRIYGSDIQAAGSSFWNWLRRHP